MTRKLLFFLFFFLPVTVFAQVDDITLVSWNIQDFGKTKSNDHLEEMAELLRHADIVVIQEVVSGFGGAPAVAKLAKEKLNETV